jgi:3'-5' exoribonuclease
MSVQLRHIVVSHHGEREKGSPVVPATREAVIVHYCDDMTARLAAVDEAAAHTADGERWSRWVNMLDSYTYLAEAVDGPATDDRPGHEAVPAAVVAAAADIEPAAGDGPRHEAVPAAHDAPESGDPPTGDDGSGEPTGAALF